MSQFPHSRLFPQAREWSWLVVAIDPIDYSASLLARAVEDCDAHLLNLNILSDTSETDSRLRVALRIDHRSPMAAARSLERYGFEVLSSEGSAEQDSDSDDDHDPLNDPNDSTRRRALELLRILSI